MTPQTPNNPPPPTNLPPPERSSYMPPQRRGNPLPTILVVVAVSVLLFLVRNWSNLKTRYEAQTQPSIRLAWYRSCSAIAVPARWRSEWSVMRGSACPWERANSR